MTDNKLTSVSQRASTSTIHITQLRGSPHSPRSHNATNAMPMATKQQAANTMYNVENAVAITAQKNAKPQNHVAYTLQVTMKHGTPSAQREL